MNRLISRYHLNPEKITYNSFKIHVSLFVTLALSSCNLFKKTTVEKKVPTAAVENKNTRELISGLKNNEFNYNWIYAKFSSDVSIDSSDNSFKVTMRGRKDSILWMSISPALGIEVARAIISKDSVKFINRLNSTYFAGDFDYISRLLNTDLDFEIIQSLLVGNSVEFYEEEEKLRGAIDNNRYLLSTIRKRKLRRVMEKNKELKDPVQSIWLEPENYKILRILFNDFQSNRTIDVNYKDYLAVDSLLFPGKINIDIKAEKKININIDYIKVNTENHQTFPFTIPSNYDPVKHK